jgi:hypothetical protein
MAGIIGLKPKIKERKEQVMTEAEAQTLQDWEDQRMINRRTRHAISGTYGPKQPTKARRKLPGKRKWKNKEKQYAVLDGQMTVKEFNLKQKAMRVLDKVYKRQHAQRQKHSLVD